jgi:hypothetical protein
MPLMGGHADRVEWQCKYCGVHNTNFKSNGKPAGMICRRRTDRQPHVWLKVRDIPAVYK